MRGIVLLALLGPFLAGHALTGNGRASGETGLQGEGLPDTPAGRCLRAYLDAFNDGQDLEMTTFARTYWPRADADEVSRRVEQERGLRKAWGTLAPVRIPQSSARAITCLLRPAGKNEWLVFRIELAEGPPQEGPPPAIEHFTRTGAEMPGGREVVPEDQDVLRLADRAMPIPEEIRARTVEQVADTLERQYVFPDAGKRMADTLRRNLAAGAYDEIRKAGALADRLTADANAVRRDRHLFIEAYRSPLRTVNALDPQEGAETSYGFRKAELLPGNIGYVRFDEFSSRPEARAVAAEVLARVQDCGALVLDLRENHGGWPEMMQFVASYLFEDRTPAGAFYDRDGRLAQEWWTLEGVPGRRFAPSAPVYVLTSVRTASAAEGFTRMLQSNGRAKVVGEKTRGAGHPAREVAVNEYFMMSVPFLRGDPDMDLEGIGVIPDVTVPAERALEEAVRLARDERSSPKEDRRR